MDDRFGGRSWSNQMVYVDPRTGATLGGALRQWREINGRTLAEVSRHCEVPITHLIEVENDQCGPTANVLIAMAKMYPEVPAPTPGDGWRTLIGWLRVFGSEARTNRQRLEVVAASLREMRNLSESDSVRMRDMEGDILVSILDLSHADVTCDIMEVFGLSSVDTREFIGASVRRAERRSWAKAPIVSRLPPGTEIEECVDVLDMSGLA